MAFTIKEEIERFKAKAEENAKANREKRALSEAKELQNLRAERIRLENESLIAQAELERSRMAERERSKIDEEKKLIGEAKAMRRQRTIQRIGKTFNFVGKALTAPPRQSSNIPNIQPTNEPVLKGTLFNPKNPWTGEVAGDIVKRNIVNPKPQSKKEGILGKMFNPVNVWSGKKVRV